LIIATLKSVILGKKDEKQSFSQKKFNKKGFSTNSANKRKIFSRLADFKEANKSHIIRNFLSYSLKR
jgi:hypothetical protein